MRHPTTTCLELSFRPVPSQLTAHIAIPTEYWRQQPAGNHASMLPLFIRIWRRDLVRWNRKTFRIPTLHAYLYSCGYSPAAVVASFRPPGYRICLIVAYGSQHLCIRRASPSPC